MSSHVPVGTVLHLEASYREIRTMLVWTSVLLQCLQHPSTNSTPQTFTLNKLLTSMLKDNNPGVLVGRAVVSVLLLFFVRSSAQKPLNAVSCRICWNLLDLSDLLLDLLSLLGLFGAGGVSQPAVLQSAHFRPALRSSSHVKASVDVDITNIPMIIIS